MPNSGLLLANLGSPASPTEADVRAYLDEFLMDARILDMPWPLRWLIVKRIAAGDRQRAVRDALGVSITTVNRGAQQYRDGCGGFDLAFDVLRRTSFPDPRLPSPSPDDAAKNQEIP